MKPYLQWLADTDNCKILENAAKSQKSVAAFWLEDEKMYLDRFNCPEIESEV